MLQMEIRFPEESIRETQASVRLGMSGVPKQDYPRREGSCSGGDRGTLPISVLEIAVSGALAGGHRRAAWSAVLFLP